MILVKGGAGYEIAMVYHIRKSTKRITLMFGEEWKRAEIAHIDKIN